MADITQNYFFINSDIDVHSLIFGLCDLKNCAVPISFMLYFQGCWLMKAHTSYNIIFYSIDALFIKWL